MGCVVTAANINDALAFEPLFLSTFAAVARPCRACRQASQRGEPPHTVRRLWAQAPRPRATPSARFRGGQAALVR
jgi:hypothetical protein